MSVVEILWPAGFIAKAVDYMAKNVRFFAMFGTFLLWVTGVIKACIYNALVALGAYILSIDLSAFKNVTLTTLEYIGYVNAFFPVTEGIALMVAYMTAASIVILVRWLKSIIPTVSN